METPFREWIAPDKRTAADWAESAFGESQHALELMFAEALSVSRADKTEMVDAVGTNMPPHVLDWVRQFPNQTIHINITADGFVSLWNRDKNQDANTDALAAEVRRLREALHSVVIFADPKGMKTKGMYASGCIQAYGVSVAALAQQKQEGGE